MLKRIPLFVVAFVASVSGCATHSVQNLTEVAPEWRIRISLWQDSPCCSNPTVGNLVGYDQDSLRLRLEGTNQSVAFSWPSIRLIESSHRASRAGIGAAVGLVVGALIGAITGAATACSNCDGDWRGIGALAGGVEGIVLGTVAGAIVGFNIQRDVWDPVTLPPRTIRGADSR